MTTSSISPINCTNLEDMIIFLADRNDQIQKVLKIALILSRQQYQDRHKTLSDEKAAWMCSKGPIVFEGINALCQIGAGFAGGQAAAKGAGLIGAGQAFNLVGNQFERRAKSHEEMAGHQYQHVTQIISDLTGKIQAAEGNISKDHDLISRITQLSMQTMQALFSS